MKKANFKARRFHEDHKAVPLSILLKEHKAFIEAGGKDRDAVVERLARHMGVDIIDDIH